MSSASNQKHGYLAVVEQVEYEERGTMWGIARIKEPEIAALRKESDVITGDFGLSQRDEWHNYVGAPRVTMSDAVALSRTPSLIPSELSTQAAACSCTKAVAYML